MPELELGEKVFLGGGGGGGDLLVFSPPCFVVKLSGDAGLVAVFGGVSRAGLAGFSITGFGSFSGAFFSSLSD